MVNMWTRADLPDTLRDPSRETVTWVCNANSRCMLGNFHQLDWLSGMGWTRRPYWQEDRSSPLDNSTSKDDDCPTTACVYSGLRKAKGNLTCAWYFAGILTPMQLKWARAGEEGGAVPLGLLKKFENPILFACVCKHQLGHGRPPKMCA